MSESGSDNPARGSRGAAGPLPRAGALPASTLISASAVAHLLTCLVCLEYVLPPFVQCRNGHLMCSRCREQHALCVACESPIDNIRNLAMEHVVSMTLFPCKYSSRGCPALLAYSDKPGHDENCQFTPCRCPCPEGWCTWRGPLRNVLPHIGRSHRGIGTLKGESIVFRVTRIDRPGTFHWVTGQSCFGHHFLVSVKKEEHHGRQQFSAEVQLIGSPRQADKFIYRLKLDGHVRRLGWEAPTRSICEGVEGATVSSVCLFFDDSIARRFAHQAVLNFHASISRP